MKIEKIINPSKETIFYVADDGLIFSDKNECFCYENRNKIREIMVRRIYFTSDNKNTKEYWFVMGGDAVPLYLIGYLENTLHIFLDTWKKQSLLKICDNLKINSDKEYYLVGLSIFTNKYGDNTVEILNIDSSEKKMKDEVRSGELKLNFYKRIKKITEVFSETI